MGAILIVAIDSWLGQGAVPVTKYLKLEFEVPPAAVVNVPAAALNVPPLPVNLDQVPPACSPVIMLKRSHYGAHISHKP